MSSGDFSVLIPAKLYYCAVFLHLSVSSTDLAARCDVFLELSIGRNDASWKGESVRDSVEDELTSNQRVIFSLVPP